MKDPIDTLDRLFLREKLLVVERDRTPPAEKLRQNRTRIADHVRQLGKSGDLNQILAAERHFLENDLAQYANSGAMKGSLDTALAELSAAEKLMGKIRDPEAYRHVDESHSLPKNRKGGLPYDEARQFFSAHAARLLNMDKSRLDAEEKKIVEIRKQNMRAADRLYVDLQRQALGLTAPTKVKGQGLEL
ncbi:hypothetical protein [Telmatospirillum sp. J64-1]|uniref:hypothetical protein n=1 Tax=Telmatospirillum sp. J64-1 TaxID=2502183 RepID=UPI00115D468C|nr:hypothetical protein [Telmatospirillum sp. J64-1]